jgi:hypothetical protein
MEQAMSVTYTATDSTGTVHTRTSARHVEPHYTHAVVMAPGTDEKRFVSFHSRTDLAMRQLENVRSMVRFQNNEKLYPNAELIELVAKVR